MTMLLTERWLQLTAEAAASAAQDGAAGDSAAGDSAAGNGATAQELLADWRKRNLVQTGHRRITVIDPAALRRLGGLGP
jgi:hypothetical protein